MPPLIGERLCLNFVNSIEPRGDPYLSPQQRATQHEYLSSYTAFLAWSLLAGIVKEEDAQRLQHQATLLKSLAAETLQQIIALREKLYVLFWHVATSHSVPEQDLTWLRQSYLDTLSHASLTKVKNQYTWQWSVDPNHLDSPIWPVMQSTLSVLTDEDLTRIKLCPGAPDAPIACSWLFYDESKNKSRHWCRMADCGSRAKARRQTARRRIKRAST